MERVEPFINLRFKENLSFEWEKIFTPPFDTIRKEEIPVYRTKSNYNVVRLILPHSYDEAEHLLKEWEKEGVLTVDEKPSILYLIQTFKFSNRIFTRKGIICALRLDEFENRSVLPHEKTIQRFKDDRFELMKRVRGNLSPVFGIFRGEGNSLFKLLKESREKKFLYQFQDDEGVINTVFMVTDAKFIKEVQKIVSPSPVLIADGHHRYETSLKYKNEIGKNLDNPESTASRFSMFYLSPENEEGLLLLPTHRVLDLNLKGKRLIEELKEFFRIKKTEFPDEEYLFRLPSNIFFILIDNQTYLAEMDYSLKFEEDDELKEINAVCIDRIIFEELFGYRGISQKGLIHYYHRVNDVVEHLKKSETSVGFLLSPPSVEKIFNLAEKGMRLPPKTTYFYPKIPTGLSFYIHMKQFHFKL